MNIKDKFLSANIPYGDIDKEMIELIYVLNFDLGLKTESCCYGHKNREETLVIFDKCVTDKDILDLAKFLLKSKREVSANGINLGTNFGEFNKCVRSFDDFEDDNKELAINWAHVFHSGHSDTDDTLYEDIKKEFMKKILADLSDYKKYKMGTKSKN